MNGHLVRVAIQDYIKFVERMRAKRAQHVALTDPDPKLEPWIDVSPAQLVDAFLQLHPQHQPYRPSLLKRYSKFAVLALSPDKWESLSAPAVS